MHKFFASDHIPASLVPRPVPGDTIGVLSRPPPSTEFGHRWRQNERLHTAVTAASLCGHRRTPRVNWLFLDNPLLGEEDKGIEFLKVFVSIIALSLVS